MPQRFGLLARRAADPPTAHLAARAIIGRAQLAPKELPFSAAHLEVEPLSLRRGRPGDIPTDLVPDPVPVDERNPYQVSFEAGTDGDAIAHTRAIASIVEQRGLATTDEQRALLADVNYLTEGPEAASPESVVPKLQELLESLDEGDRGLSNEDLDAFEENLSGLADIGFRQPYDYVRDVMLDLADETSDEQPAYAPPTE